MQRGQRVIVSLSEYPVSSYGNIEGLVEEVSASPDEDDQYEIIVTLQKGLITSNGKNIKFKQGMHGTAKIITEDLRLLERILHKLRNTKSVTG